MISLLKFLQTIYQSCNSSIVVPRKGYKTITVKDEIFYKFQKAIQDAKERDPKMENSKFLDSLLDKHKKSK